MAIDLKNIVKLDAVMKLPLSKKIIILAGIIIAIAALFLSTAFEAADNRDREPYDWSRRVDGKSRGKQAHSRRYTEIPEGKGRFRGAA